ncbi:MAG: hypothetical protein ACO2PQ_06450 [Thermoflexus sp.]
MSEALEIIVIEERLGASTYREHTPPFILESPRGSPGWRCLFPGLRPNRWRRSGDGCRW